jgi:formate dehydrogenase maturation protein FdhE
MEHKRRGGAMDNSKSIEGLVAYKDVLGDDVIAFFTDLWALQEDFSTDDILGNLKTAITHMGIKAPEFKDAVKAILESDDAIELPDPITVESVDKLLKTLADEAGIDPDSEDGVRLALATVAAIQPKAVEQAEKIEAPDKSELEIATCPSCGAPAALGILRDEGQAHGGSRVLWCGLCLKEWAFPRIKCARCGSEAQEDMQFFFAEGDKAHRVYACNKCKGTLKVINEAEMQKLSDPRVEEIVCEFLLDAVIAGEGD